MNARDPSLALMDFESFERSTASSEPARAAIALKVQEEGLLDHAWQGSELRPLCSLTEALVATSTTAGDRQSLRP